MEKEEKKPIEVSVTVGVPVHLVWQSFTEPAHIVHWNNASADWHTPLAENDLRVGGKFLSRMEAKDGSFGFEFWGIYDEVQPHQRIAYTLGDDRKVTIVFTEAGDQTNLVETFEPEGENPVALQKGGWQAILDNFKAYTEKNFASK